MASSSDASLIRELPRALLHPLPVALAVGTIIAGAIHLLLAIPAAVAWAVATGVIAGRRAEGKSRPDVSTLPPSIQADLLDVTTALDQLQSAVRSVPEEQRPLFEGIEREANEVRDSVLKLGETAGALHRHLEATHSGEAERELEQLRARLEAAEDGPQRRELEAGIGQLESRLERRKRLLERLDRYRATLHSLETTARELADRAVNLATGAPMGYDTLDEQSPERKISEMKASVAALEEVLRTDTETM